MTPNPDRVLIFDTTLRDGEQSPGCSMTAAEKLRVARALAELGVDVIEAGFPAASRGDFDSVATVAREVQGPIICGLARCTPEDIGAAARALAPAARRLLDVLTVAACQAADHRPLHLARHRADALEVPARGRRESRLDDIHTKLGEGACHAQLLGPGHAAAGSLLAVAQRGVEDQHLVRIDSHGLGFLEALRR